MKNHIFLTGDIQVGKSTILRNVIAAHPEWRVGGYRTVWLEERSPNRNSIHIVPAAEDVPLTDVNRVGIREGVWPDRICTDFTEVYDTVGAALLKDAGESDLILMDEIGQGENEARQFHQAVLSLLDGDTPVMGVVRDKPGVLPDLVRAHPNVQVVVVTVENRDRILEQLLAERR